METITGLYHRRYVLTGENGNIGKILKRYLNNYLFYNDFIDSKSDDIFLHLAARVDKDIVESNILFLKECIEFCLKKEIKKFIFFSSAAVYGDINKENVIERECNSNISLYAASKIFGEKLLFNYRDRLNILVLRLPAVLTNQKNSFICKLKSKLQRDEDIELYNYDKEFNGFIGVKDIAEFIKGFQFRKDFEILNFAPELNQTLKDVVLHLKMRLKSKSKIIYCNEDNLRYYNLSVDKLKNEYGFASRGYKEILDEWIDNEK